MADRDDRFISGLGELRLYWLSHRLHWGLLCTARPKLCSFYMHCGYLPC